MSATGPRLRVVPAPPRDEPERPLPAAGPMSLDEAFRTYADYVATIAYRILGRRHEVDDVVQDVFLAGHQGLGLLRQPDAIKAWLATVTVRVTRRRLWVRRFRSFLHLEDLETGDGPPSSDASPEDRAAIVELYAALDELPPAERVAWTLRVVAEEDLATVAQACGCSLATAKRRIAAAQRALERRLSHG